MERDFTSIYKKFRRSYRSTIVNVVPLRKAVFENEIYTSLINRDSDTIELRTLTTLSSSSSPPSAERRWVDGYGGMQQFLVDLEGAIENLRAEHERSRLTIDWEANNSSSTQRHQTNTNNRDSQLFKQIIGVSDYRIIVYIIIEFI